MSPGYSPGALSESYRSHRSASIRSTVIPPLLRLSQYPSAVVEIASSHISCQLGLKVPRLVAERDGDLAYYVSSCEMIE